MEAMLKNPSPIDPEDKKLQWFTKHVPISISIASNATGFKEPKCIVELNKEILINKMMCTLLDITRTSYHLLTGKYSSLILQLDEPIESYQSTQTQDSDYESTNTSNHILNVKQVSDPFINLKKEFERCLRQIPVLGFNSEKHDLNFIKKHIMAYITYRYKQNKIFTIKKNNTYMSIGVPEMKFLDISNYLAVGCSYSKFLKGYGCKIAEGIFPYEWLGSPEKLDQPHLPPPETFYSKISNTNPIQTDEDYNHLKVIWN